MIVDRTVNSMEELAQKMIALEDQAFSEFAAIFGYRFRALFLKKGLTAADAEDLAVSCVTDIALKVNRYEKTQEGSFEAWVFTLARHALVDWRRKNQATVPLDEEMQMRQSSETDSTPNLKIIFAVHEALDQLSEDNRTLVQLRNFGGNYTYAEIGEQLCIEEGTARVRYSRAKNELRALLEKDPRVQPYIERGKKSKPNL